MSRRFEIGVFAFLSLCVGLVSEPARAHPHVTIAVDAAIVFEQGLVSRLNFRWHFSAAYVEGLKAEFDTDRDGVLSDVELEGWLAQARKSIEARSAFTHLEHAGKMQQVGVATGFTMQRKDGGLDLVFELPLSKAVDVRAKPLAIELYDPSFFTALEFDAGTVRLTAGSPDHCTAVVALAPNSRQQKAITMFVKLAGAEARLAPAKAITVVCGD